jgi:signal transduction histidine kinase
MERFRNLKSALPFLILDWQKCASGFVFFLILTGSLLNISAQEKPTASNGAEMRPSIFTNFWPDSSTKLSATYNVGWWIWSAQTYDQQTCRFWRAFEIPRSAAVTYARIRMTVDNSYRLFLDGREIGKGGNWSSLNEFNVTPLLDSGAHTLAVDCFSDYSAAGMIFGLHIELSNGRVIEILSDKNWRVVPNTEEKWQTRKVADANWPAATVIAPYGEAHWKQTSARIIQAPSLHPIVLAFWQKAWFQITLLCVCSIAVLISVYLMSQLASQSKAQQFLQRERARIARDIHDDVGARLSHLVLLGERAQRAQSPDRETQLQLDQICERTREVLGAIDEVVWTVNSKRDTIRDFETYVCNYAETFLQSAGIRCRSEVETDIPEGAFDLAIRRNLFLAIKEAINNAAKYSGATELFLRIHLQGKELVVIVEDNGKGFDPARANSNRNGLTNMSQRIVELGGQCKIISRPGNGCRVEFKTPLVHSRNASPWWSRLFKNERAKSFEEKAKLRTTIESESLSDA